MPHSSRSIGWGYRVIMEPIKIKGKVARPERFELPTFWFVARRSIQLSYGRAEQNYFSMYSPAVN
jgi:hypothetical protein